MNAQTPRPSDAPASATDLVGELTRAVSHDLRAPLRAILGFGQRLEKSNGDRLDEKGRSHLGRVLRAGVRFERLLIDLETFCRAFSGDEPLESVPARELVDRVLAELAEGIARSGATIRVEPALPVLRVRRENAACAIRCLVSNALKFTRDELPPEIEIGPLEPAQGAAGEGIYVRDHGPGIAPGHVARCLELFGRGVGAEVEGTGSGLAIARAVAVEHRGELSITPRPGGLEAAIRFGVGRDE